MLLHGALASTGPAWAGSTNAHVDHLATLGKHFRVIAPDTRGSGATVHRGGPSGFDVLADDVASLIDALGLERPMIAGLREGAATATLVALRRPERIRALVNHSEFHYFAAAHMKQQLERDFRPLFGGKPGATAADPDAAERTAQQIPPMAANFTTMQSDYDSAQGEGHWRTYIRQFFDRTIASVGRTSDDFAGLSMPTLMLAGDRDMLCPVEVACAAYRGLESGALGIVPNTGHGVTSAIVDTMIQFLSGQV